MKASLLLGTALLWGCAAEVDAAVSEAPIQTAGMLTFRTDQISDYTRCVAEIGSRCADADHDGLDDAWEDAVLARFEPRIEFDEKEKGLTDPSFRMGIAGRVVARKDDPHRIVVFFAIAYSEDYGSCTFTEHHGDVERAVLELEREPGTKGDVTLRKAFTAAHEGDITDASHIYQGDTASLEKSLEFVSEGSSSRWLVYASRNKHGTYANMNDCESRKIPCIADYCRGDGSKSRNDYRRLLPILNAGEPAHPRDSDWGGFGYENADAWSGEAFCGTAVSGDCDSAPRTSLLRDPFTKKDI